MAYLPDSNKLNINLLKARNLHIRQKIGSADPYVKLWLVQKGRVPRIQQKPPLFSLNGKTGFLPSFFAEFAKLRKRFKIGKTQDIREATNTESRF